MKYDIQFTNQFKKDLKLAKKQNKNLDKLFEVIDILANGGTLDAKYRDHDLTGNYKGTRECRLIMTNSPFCNKLKFISISAFLFYSAGIISPRLDTSPIAETISTRPFHQLPI